MLLMCSLEESLPCGASRAGKQEKSSHLLQRQSQEVHQQEGVLQHLLYENYDRIRSYHLHHVFLTVAVGHLDQLPEMK
jgi:hypothetical protein